ncbi:M23 family metallopeptidase [Polaribacter sp. BAL334]|uniref:M23 family metallopeptidase n=1 Tax=Polaribacter sp. BAL334 TaxID=1708178 RepID=UPI0018D26F5D|nr:M23 family metallopeptidase [Polaribacter sp. BAL334]MBG7612872.1 M23 family metallopeptidase [Polaribacter sp. BAL334]
MKHFTLIFLTFISFYINSQEKYPKDYFQSPLKIPIVLSGSFGELRNNHFHSGLDIKTQGKEGLEVLAAGEGYVSRIKLSQFGYGKSIYITHPNGFTTVYAHLSKFAPKIESYVKSIQYKKECYEIEETRFSEDTFPIEKGEIIAFSGDTGGSGGPHLHFEIRDTESEKIINPLFFNFAIQDTIAPIFQSVKVYSLSENSHINQQNNHFQLPIKKIAEGEHIADKISAQNLIGFGVEVIDKMDSTYNKLGIYSLEMQVNGQSMYYHELETFDFAESKFINLHIDYEHFKKYKTRFQKTYLEPANALSTYKNVISFGKINIEKEFNYTINIIAKDFYGNTSMLKIPVVGKDHQADFNKKIDSTAFQVIAKNFNKFNLEDVTIAFPKNTFYEDTFLDFKVEKGIAKIHNPTIPLDDYFTLTFDVSKYSEEEKKQLYIANLEYPKYPRYLYTRKKDSTFFTTTKYLGNYSLVSDNQKPTIKLMYIKDGQWISNSETLKVKISDIGSGIDTFRATLNDEWILMEYNHKTGILTYDFSDKILVGSKHLFKIVVYDNVGNTNELSATFFKKQVN